MYKQKYVGSRLSLSPPHNLRPGHPVIIQRLSDTEVSSSSSRGRVFKGGLRVSEEER